MKILVCGGREHRVPLEVMKNTLLAHRCTYVINGGARGVDSTAAAAAQTLQIPYLTVPAPWDRWGKIAGTMRNTLMLEEKPDLVIAFPGGKGTANMAKQAEERGIQVAYVATPGPR